MSASASNTGRGRAQRPDPVGLVLATAAMFAVTESG
jgi:hypothetical protein